MKNFDVSIIIPNYNGEKLLEKNFPKVIEAAKYYRKKSTGGVEVIMVDDASTDESVKIVQSSKLKVQSHSLKWSHSSFARTAPKIKVIRNENNLGFSSTVNKGVSEANGEVIVLLNTDVTPERGFLMPLLEHFEDEKVFAVGCMDKSIEGSRVVLRGRGIGSWKRGMFIHQRGEVDDTNTLWVAGGSGAFRKIIWEKLQGLDALYDPFYWEDIDLSYRAQKMGFTILFDSKSIVVHEHGKGAVQEHFSPFWVKTISYRNQFVFIWKNITDTDLIFSHLFWMPYNMLTALVRLDFPFLYGLSLAIFKSCAILSKRPTLRKLFVKTDKEILAQFEAKL